MVWPTTTLLLSIFFIDYANAVHEEHPEFRPYKEVERYKEKEMNYGWDGLVKWKKLEKKGFCHCGRVELANMALVYLDRTTLFEEKNGHEVKEPQRYLVSRKTMGSGSYSKVYHAIPFDEKAAEKCVAIKIHNATVDYGENGMEELEVEAAKLNWLSTPRNKHIIKLYEILSYEDKKGKEKTALILELGEMGLDEYFEMMMEAIEEGEFLFIVKQMLLGLSEVHETGYIHFDLKPENMLAMPDPPRINNDVEEQQIADQVYVKYIDFAGLVGIPPDGGVVRRNQFNIIWTPKYTAPEIYNSGNKKAKLTKAYDIWSLGVSIISLLAETQLFKEQLDDAVYKEADKKELNSESKWNRVIIVMARQVIAKNARAKYPRIAKLLATLETHFPKSMEIVKKCLQIKPASRPTVRQLLEHDGIFTDIDLSEIYTSRDSNAETFGTGSSREMALRKIYSNIANRRESGRKKSSKIARVIKSGVNYLVKNVTRP